MDDKKILREFCFFYKSVTLNEIDNWKKVLLQQLHSTITGICLVLNLEKALVFDYGYTIKLLLVMTN